MEKPGIAGARNIRPRSRTVKLFSKDSLPQHAAKIGTTGPSTFAGRELMKSHSEIGANTETTPRGRRFREGPIFSFTQVSSSEFLHNFCTDPRFFCFFCGAKKGKPPQKNPRRRHPPLTLAE
jgi:hypothetical protein